MISDALSSEVDAAQRRNLTLFFSDLSDSTRIAATMEPEDYAELLQHVRTLAEQIIPRHGGEIVRIDGDGILCVFGLPVEHDDAARRATEAAIDLHAATSVLDQSFASTERLIRLHTGIHSGIVLLRSGDLVRGRFELLGDATNIAARVCDHAGPDEIYVSEAALGADRPFFSVGSRQLVPISGRENDLPVYPVFGREPTANRFAARIRRGVAIFAGRAAQLMQLDENLGACADGACRVVILVGPAGIGKTRLASEFLDRAVANGATVHRGDCEAYLGARPLQPFLQIARTLVDPTLAVADEVSESSDIATTEQRLLQSLLASLSKIDVPIILSIDDWQWADDASRLLFDSMRSAAPHGVLFLLSTRPDDALLTDTGDTVIIEVPPLAHEEAGIAIEGLLATSEPFLVGRIRDHAGGSPLFIEELCHAFGEDENASTNGDRSAWLDMLIQARFARLPPHQAMIFRGAAIIGRVIPGWLFHAITGVATDDPAVRQLMHEDFIYEAEAPGWLRFKHGITRDAIYRTISRQQRLMLHRRVADALHLQCAIDGEDEHLEALAYHHDAARNGNRAAHYAVMAGDRAMNASALDRAQAHYRSAIENLAKLADGQNRQKKINQAIHRFGLACVADPSPDQLAVLVAATARAESAENIEGATLCNYWLGIICYGLGRSQASINYLNRAMAMTNVHTNPRLLVQLHANLGQSYSAAGDYRLAETWLDAAIPAMTEFSSGMETGLAYASACRGFLLADQGQFAEADPYYAKAEALLAGVTTALRGSVVTQQAAVSLWRGDYLNARRYAEKGIEIGQKSRSRYYVMMSTALGAFARWKLSGDPDAVGELVKCAQWFVSGASRQRTSLCFGWLAEIMAAMGRTTETRYYTALALSRARHGDRLGEAMACRAMAMIAANGHGRRAASHYLDLANRSASIRRSPRECALNKLCAEAVLHQPAMAISSH
jgi:class 3 adenylate cyclase/tetratricopeptide (TPR) repeat protein